VAQRLVKSRAGVEEILHLDLSAAMLERARAAYDAARAAARDGDSWPRVRYIQADEEMLPLAPDSVDRGWRPSWGSQLCEMGCTATAARG
jgi:hypothetical protein